jgi:hypothetical protein
MVGLSAGHVLIKIKENINLYEYVYDYTICRSCFKCTNDVALVLYGEYIRKIQGNKLQN